MSVSRNPAYTTHTYFSHILLTHTSHAFLHTYLHTFLCIFLDFVRIGLNYYGISHIVLYQGSTFIDHDIRWPIGL